MPVLNNYDYSQEGAYYVTIVTPNRKCLFGQIDRSQVHLNEMGIIVKEVWQSIPLHFPQASVDCFVIMPNHVHGIIILAGARLVFTSSTLRAVPLQIG